MRSPGHGLLKDKIIRLDIEYRARISVDEMTMGAPWKLSGVLFFAAWLIQLLPALGLCYKPVERLEAIPNGWSQGGRPQPSTMLKLHLEIRGPGSVLLEQRTLDLSTPSHPQYGKYLRREEVEELLRPASHIHSKVLAWLGSAGVSNDSIKIHSNWILFGATVSQAEQMLDTQFSYYHSDNRQAPVIRTLEYSVPREIHPYIHLIQPTTKFETRAWHGKGMLQARATLPVDQPIVATSEDLNADCGTVIRPDCLRELYGLHGTKAQPDPRNRLGVSGFLDQHARHIDFHHFMQRFSPEESDANFNVITINGGINPEDSFAGSTEASLDIQYAAALAYNASVTFYSTGGRAASISGTGELVSDQSENEPFLDQLHYLLSLSDDELPAVLSTSYGEIEQSVPILYARSVCNLFAQLSARGVSVIYSSGDSGVGESCLSNDGQEQATFQTIFPASCPFVTAVGGVEGINPEIALDFSSGGFSKYFTRPGYQEGAVQPYLNHLGDKWNSLYNHHGRATPDVAAQAKNFIIRDHETYLKISGTSAAGPVFAGIVSQLNAIRLANGQPRMGFLNPWLYSVQQAGFTDILQGGSRGCTGNLDSDAPGALVPYASWNATEGWDPVTGLGTPRFPRLAELALSRDGQAWTKYVVFSKQKPY